MINGISKQTIKGQLQFEVGEWKYITSEYFYSLSENETLTWYSVNPNIAQVNTDSGLVYAKSTGTTTVFANDKNDSNVKILCSVEVHEKDAITATTKLVTDNTEVELACVGGNGDNITALGYSGTVFSYSLIGNKVTLEKGFATKVGVSNTTSYLFRAKLVEMDNIYDSMSENQKKAWLKLRLNDFISLVGLFNPKSVTETAKNIAKEILSSYAIDLGTMLESTILGVYNWYLAEQSAVSYYENY